MTPREAVALCRLAKACCPQQQFDEFTADAWGELLADIPLDEAKAALLECAKASPFVAPAEIRAQVRTARAQRIREHPPLVPPEHLAELSDEEFDRAYQQWYADCQRRIAAGEVIEQPAVGRRVDPAQIEDVFPKVPDA